MTLPQGGQESLSSRWNQDAVLKNLGSPVLDDIFLGAMLLKKLEITAMMTTRWNIVKSN